VPFSQAALVITTSAPNPSAADPDPPVIGRNHHPVDPETACAASQLRWIRDFLTPVAPVSSTSALPGYRARRSAPG
jgi:hypothetical protein